MPAMGKLISAALGFALVIAFLVATLSPLMDAATSGDLSGTASTFFVNLPTLLLVTGLLAAVLLIAGTVKVLVNR